jgi:hypothetical protein
VSRLFHALVVLGAGVSAANCGGKTVEATSDGNASAGAGGSQGASGATGGNRDGNHGGSPIIIIGGGEAGQGGQPIHDAGPPTDVGAGPDLTGGGTYSQWTCPTKPDFCSEVVIAGAPYMDGYILSQPCPSDPTRPRTEADCAANQWFTCQVAVWMAQPIAVNCECTPKTSADCDYFDGCFHLANPVATTCTEHSKLCGCAYTGILK